MTKWTHKTVTCTIEKFIFSSSKHKMVYAIYLVLLPKTNDPKAKGKCFLLCQVIVHTGGVQFHTTILFKTFLVASPLRLPTSPRLGNKTESSEEAPVYFHSSTVTKAHYCWAWWDPESACFLQGTETWVLLMSKIKLGELWANMRETQIPFKNILEKCPTKSIWSLGQGFLIYYHQKLVWFGWLQCKSYYVPQSSMVF